jgi:CheY-like chemotaxis protein
MTPYEQNPMPGTGTDNVHSADGSRANLLPETPSFAGRRVLVADDNPVNRHVAVHLLHRLGVDVEAAATGREAVRLQGEKPYDLLLMDCQMPELDGYEATARIRQAESASTPSRRTPVVALTMSATREERDRCLAAGMDDLLSKPIRPQELKQTLHCWLQDGVATTAIDDGSDRMEAIKAMFGANFAEVAMLYCSEAPGRIAGMRDAHAAGDRVRLANIAHIFSGSCMSIGAASLAACCRDLELRARSGMLDDLTERIAAIEREYGRVGPRLQSMTDGYALIGRERR